MYISSSRSLCRNVFLHQIVASPNHDLLRINKTLLLKMKMVKITCSWKVASLDTFFGKKDDITYTFFEWSYPKKTHLTALNIIFLSFLWTCTKETHPNILGWRLFVWLCGSNEVRTMGLFEDKTIEGFPQNCLETLFCQRSTLVCFSKCPFFLSIIPFCSDVCTHEDSWIISSFWQKDFWYMIAVIVGIIKSFLIWTLNWFLIIETNCIKT